MAAPEGRKQEVVLKDTLASMFGGEISVIFTQNMSYSTSITFVSWFGHSMSRHFTYGMFADYYNKTVSALSSLFLALVLYPEVQKRAQTELDTVIARNRLPTFDDRPRIPYIDALCRELLRWQMVLPLSASARS